MKEKAVKNLDWLVEEFNLLFEIKNRKYCKYDKTLANQLIACFSRNSDFTNNEKLNEMFMKTLKALEDLYPLLLESV